MVVVSVHPTLLTSTASISRCRRLYSRACSSLAFSSIQPSTVTAPLPPRATVRAPPNSSSAACGTEVQSWMYSVLDSTFE